MLNAIFVAAFSILTDISPIQPQNDAKTAQIDTNTPKINEIRLIYTDIAQNAQLCTFSRLAEYDLKQLDLEPFIANLPDFGLIVGGALFAQFQANKLI